MKKNYKIYGYPFVNSNWQPHYTIASLSKKIKKSSFLRLFKTYERIILFFKTQKIYFFQIKKK